MRTFLCVLLVLWSAPLEAQRIGHSQMRHRHVTEGELEEACIGTECLGVLTLPNGKRHFWRHGRKAEEIRPVDRDEAPPIIASQSATVASREAMVADGVVHDVLVAATAKAVTDAGGWVAFQNLAALATASANRSYANSQVPLILRLVDVMQTPYVESGSDSTDLSRLSGPQWQNPNTKLWEPSPYLADVRRRRNSAGADFAQLVISGYGCGISFLLSSNQASFESMAFSVANLGCFYSNKTFQHEIGHGQGLQHDPANGSGAMVPYAYGYQDPGGAFRTIMAYGSAPRVEQFSNPDVLYNGRVTGVVDKQDNARALRLTELACADFRAPAGTCTYAASVSPAVLGAAGGTTRLTITPNVVGCGWRVTTNSPWLLSQFGNDTGWGARGVTFVAAANTAPFDREAVLTIEDTSITFTIRQQGSTSEPASVPQSVSVQ